MEEWRHRRDFIYIDHLILSAFVEMTCFNFFIYNLNRQSEFTFYEYKLTLWLLQCLDGESPSGESPVPQIRPIGQFLLSLANLPDLRFYFF
jgi:hypothetical protein